MFSDKPTLTGERVALCPVGPEHVDGLWELVSDPETRRLTGSHAPADRGAVARWYASRRAHVDRLDLAICDAEDGAYVGEVVLNELDPENLACNLRIALVGPRAYGKGYGTEALRLTLAHAFEEVGLHRVSLEVFAFNARARRVYEKVGFVREGVLRDALRWDGAWHDAIVMSVLAPDWKAHRGRPPH
ncbi:acetyltransferase [Sphaerisporangium siamense]|uniref:RimJ/RimL family protein N-acetyltransferase n=1 Tax=Sphaerisporangium siamense TaxID=795645 RepID=A0A7W7D716_9ACTN|nr:GNAT family protein [Sphaerisporangium siamense]MBB4701488.1 RimJ/RimL family protein N-acetyltransferase [Sphaerisporangium siamense]GII85612.1 acetyltransferase [Sphaerisporangium siamense]